MKDAVKAAKQELANERAERINGSAPKSERRSRVLFTPLGGLNLERFDTYDILTNGDVVVYYPSHVVTLHAPESGAFLRLVGDARNREPVFNAKPALV